MPFVKIWLHCVWGTKNRIHLLTPEKKLEVFEHIKSNAKSKGIHIDFINGHTEHVHCLLSLNPEQSLSKVMQLIKGESSFWINKNAIIRGKFEWADEYFGVSVSESLVPNVRDYIKNQEEHHRKITWEEEYKDFIGKYGFHRDKG